jgi:hypothetical protein
MTPCLQSDVYTGCGHADLASQLSVSSREIPQVTPAGTLMARRSCWAGVLTADPLQRLRLGDARMAAMGPVCASAFDSATGQKSKGLLTLPPTGGSAGYVGYRHRGVFLRLADMAGTGHSAVARRGVLAQWTW